MAKQSKKKIDIKSFAQLTGLIWLVIGLGIDLLYFIIFGRKILDSDMAGEMILAKLLNSERSVFGISRHWYYSTELRVLHMQWFYRIGLLFSPNNWYVARVIGMVIGLALLVFAVYRLFANINMKECGIWAASLCIFPGGSWYFWQTLYGGFYLPYILISIFVLDLIVLCVNDRKKCAWYLPCLLLLGFLSGLNGIKQLMVFYAPLVIGCFLFTCLQVRGKCGKGCSGEIKMMILSLDVTASAVIGYIINSRILSRYYQFKQYGDQEITQGGIWEYLKLYVWSFGFAYDRKLMSFTGIAAMLGLLLGLGTLFSAWRLIKRWNDHELLTKLLISVSVMVIAFNVFIFAYVGGEIQYFQPTVPFGLFLIALELFTEGYIYKYSRNIALNGVMLAMLITSVGTVRSELGWPMHYYNAKVTMDDAVSYVTDAGYTKGIGSFWVSNLMTELSDGKLEMWTIEEPESFEVYPWLQVTSHSDGLPDGKYFVISEASEDYSNFLEVHPDFEVIYNDGSLVVYGN